MGKWLNVAAEKRDSETAKHVLSKTSKSTLDNAKPALNTLAAMRKSQPPGWGWWGFILADDSRGSIRGPYPDEQSALAVVQAEFGQPAVRLVPLPGSLPKPEANQAGAEFQDSPLPAHF